MNVIRPPVPRKQGNRLKAQRIALVRGVSRITKYLTIQTKRSGKGAGSIGILCSLKPQFSFCQLELATLPDRHPTAVEFFFVETLLDHVEFFLRLGVFSAYLPKSMERPESPARACGS